MTGGGVGANGFEEFVRTSSPRVLHLAELLCGDRHRAEDIAQTAYARLYPRWGGIDDPYAFTRRVVINLRNDWWRRGNRERPGPVPDLAVPDASAATDRRVVVLAALARLTPKERRVLVLRFYEDLTEREIALVLSIAPGTVKSTANRALTKLREAGHLDDLAPVPVGERRA